MPAYSPGITEVAVEASASEAADAEAADAEADAEGDADEADAAEAANAAAEASAAEAAEAAEGDAAEAAEADAAEAADAEGDADVEAHPVRIAANTRVAAINMPSFVFMRKPPCCGVALRKNSITYAREGRFPWRKHGC